MCIRDRFTEVVFKKQNFSNCIMHNISFFKTCLKGVDLSTCQIEGLTVSDTYKELSGLKISGNQAEDIIKLLGVKIT